MRANILGETWPVHKCSGRASLRKRLLSCHPTGSGETEVGSFPREQERALGSLRNWRKHGWSPRRMERQEPDDAGSGGPWEGNVGGNRVVGSHWRIFSLGVTWSYMCFVKHWPQGGEWIGTRPGMVWAIRYIIWIAFSWFLFFLHSLPPVCKTIGLQRKHCNF